MPTWKTVNLEGANQHEDHHNITIKGNHRNATNRAGASMKSRREFLRITATVAGGLLAEFTWLPARGSQASVRFGAFVVIEPNSKVTFSIPVPEIGQGVRTAMAAILADEIGLDLSHVVTKQAPADSIYGGMAAAGSDSMADYYDRLRQVGAEIRQRFELVACQRQNSPLAAIKIEQSFAHDSTSGRKVSIFELASAAASLPIAEQTRLRPKHTLLGKAIPNVDAKSLIDGSAEYGLDIRLPGQCYAVIERSPVFASEVAVINDSAARKVKGVIDVIELRAISVSGDNYASTRGGVAVIAKSTWAAILGRRLLRIEWHQGAHATESSPSISKRLHAAFVPRPDQIVRRIGEPEKAFQTATKRVEASYELPLLAHACMEPMNFTAWVKADGAELFGPVQVPRSVQSLAAALLGMDKDRIKVTASRCGGGYGRRLAYDYAVEAIQLSRRLKRPVQVVWSREDDLSQDYYRPPSVHRLTAAIDAMGQVTAWRHHLVTSSLRSHVSGAATDLKPLYDVQGAFELPFSIPNLELAYSHIPIGTQCGSWRSVSHSSNVFVVNAFIDQLAQEVGVDAITMHKRLFAGREALTVRLPLPGRRGNEVTDLARYHKVCDAVAAASRWGKQGKQRYQGFAACRYKKSYCATIAEVVLLKGKPKVRRITTAIDCGRVINTNGVKAQVEGAAMDGWATVFQWGLVIQNGRATQRNFDAWRMPRMADAPDIHTIFVGNDNAPSGAGEPPYPAVVPAIINALAALTGQRYRTLPVENG